MEINNIGNYQLAESEGETTTDQAASGASSSFSDLLQDSLQTVNNYQQEASQASQELALGKADSVHQVMIAAKKAETTLNLATEIQSKAVKAYEEIMRMRV